MNAVCISPHLQLSVGKAVKSHNFGMHPLDIVSIKVLCPTLPTVFPSFSLHLRTSLKIVSGPSQKRRNLKIMNSLPNLPWPSPHRQRVSVWIFFLLLLSCHDSQ